MTLKLHPTDLQAFKNMAQDIPQSVLLHGEEGIGTGTAATQLAALAKVPVIKTVEPDEKGTIKIEQVRGIYELVRGKNSGQVVIIDSAESMSSAAQNAFLKLLEEPIGQTKFILTSHKPSDLLATVSSRVQSVALHKISREDSDSLITELGVQEATARSQMLFMAEGLPAKLTRLATDSDYFDRSVGIVRSARTFLTGNTESRLLTAITYSADRLEASAFLDAVIKLARLSLSQDPQERTMSLLNTILDAKSAIKENGNVRLWLTKASV